MLIAKRLKEMALPGLTFGEHCENLEELAFSMNGVPACGLGRIDTVFMRNQG